MATLQTTMKRLGRKLSLGSAREVPGAASRQHTAANAMLSHAIPLTAARAPTFARGLLRAGHARRTANAPRLSARASAAASGNGGSAEYDYDMFTIGAGSGGVRASRFASTVYGARVAVAELPFTPTDGGMGGTCVLRGCVPKKLLVYGSSFSGSFENSVGFGWEERPLPSHDWGKLMANKSTELQRLLGIYGNILKNNDVEIHEGKATIVDPHTVEVAGKRFTARYILVCTGCVPSVPNIPGRDLCITSDEALSLPRMPKRVAIVGGGYIAVEFACIFKGLGAEVDLYIRKDRILRGFDEEVRDFLQEQIGLKGITIHAGKVPAQVVSGEDGKKGVCFAEGAPAEQWYDEVMYATGRVPRTEGLGLENAGVATSDPSRPSAIVVDALGKTSCESVYAVGDVTDRIQLTPVALNEGMAVARTLFGGVDTEPDHEYVASAVFSQPPVASVGYTEEQAVDKFGKVKVFTSNFRAMKHTLSGSQERNFMKLVVCSATDRVVGVHMVGEDAAEIMQGMAVAVKMGATKADFDATIGIHPTSAEEFVTMRSVTREVEKAAATEGVPA